jgi:hypothetical protein
LNANNFRPLQGFADVNLATHNLYANYNSMQVKYLRTRGRAIINMNYTFGKALGIVNTGSFDQFNLENNYTVQPTNRTHIFNVAYSYDFGRIVRGNKIAGGVINGWQFSGIGQWQSGTNLTGQRTQNFGINLNGAKIPGTTFNVSTTSLLGTPNMQLNPILTCDPKANLGPHQFLNPSCFSYPTQIGQNGPTTLLVIYGPGYLNTDLGLFKNFQVSEKKKLQFRMNAYNFMNHPLWSFGGSSNLNLGFNGTSGLLNTPNFGTTTTKQGKRVVQLAIKFTF